MEFNKLTYNALSLFLELDRWDVVPPLVNAANVVKLSSLIIESVGYLVSYNHSNPSKVETLGKVFVVKWRLQNSRRKHWKENKNVVRGVYSGGGGEGGEVLYKSFAQAWMVILMELSIEYHPALVAWR